MRGLFDVNFIVALIDPAHVCHDAAHAWFEENRASGWATCPLTENGALRVISNPAYPGGKTPIREALDVISAFVAVEGHSFWPDAVSFPRVVARKHLTGHRQITDLYLLALAVANNGRLVTFDHRLQIHAIPKAHPENLVAVNVS